MKKNNTLKKNNIRKKRGGIKSKKKSKPAKSKSSIKKDKKKSPTSPVNIPTLMNNDRLLDLVKVKEVYDNTFDYLKNLDVSEIEKIKEMVDSQDIDTEKIELLNSIFVNYNPPFTGQQPIPPFTDFDIKNEKDCFMGYKNIKTLGQGMYGTSFLVEKGKEQFALKQQKIVTEQWSIPKKDQIDLIKNEILISKEMGEKNIGPKIYDFNICEENGILKINILMEYMNGGTLKEWYDKNLFKKTHRNEIEEKINRTHDEGIFHRDVHLENIFVNVDKSGEPHFYLGDFGLARTLDGLTSITKQMDFNSFNSGLAMVENDKYMKTITKLFIMNGLV
jgi:tRNA A-37 threonylcarbamoyl transferase component Bud32